MRKIFFTFAASTVLLASGITASHAQQGPSGPMMQQQDRPGMMMQQRGGGAGQQGSQPETTGPGMMGRTDGPGMMDSDMRGRAGSGPGRMGPGMMTMMMVMMDTNGDRALSLEEVQAVHTRMFNYADGDKDGKLTLEELQSFFHGGALRAR
jgi:hypothetical protein